jgi:hypothetical protein
MHARGADTGGTDLPGKGRKEQQRAPGPLIPKRPERVQERVLEEEVLERLRVAAQTRVRVSTWRHPVPSAAGPGAPQKAAPHKPQRDRTWYVLYARAAYSTAFLSVCMPVLPCPCHAAGHAPLWARAWPGAPTGSNNPE